jgi:hypothetical protein
VIALIGPALALAALAAGLVAFVRLPPPQALAALVLSAALALAALRQFVFAFPLAVLGVNLWRRAGARAAPWPGQQSEARTERLAMTLDHDSGSMDGLVLAGAFEGRRLSDLAADELRGLFDELEAVRDEDSLSLLQAWLDRRGGTTGGTGSGPEPPPSRGAMTEAEALRILGLEPGASPEEIRAAHHRLMRRVHPDLGGSDALAAMINAAKERLDPG